MKIYESMNQFGLQIEIKVNVQFATSLQIFIVLTVVIMSGYVLTIGNNIMWTNILEISF